MDWKDIEKAALFQGLSKAELTDCCTMLHAQEREYKKGTILLHAGDQTDSVALVLAGGVTIESTDLWGNCTVLNHVGPGQFFAETYAILPNKVMLVDVRASVDSHILFLNVGSLLENMPASSWREKLIRNILMISAQKNLALSGRSFHTSPKSARNRLLSYLNSVSLQKQSTEFDIPFDRQQLADYLNLERTNMSKELGRMRRDGLIEFRKSHFKLFIPPVN